MIIRIPYPPMKILTETIIPQNEGAILEDMTAYGSGKAFNGVNDEEYSSCAAKADATSCYQGKQWSSAKLVSKAIVYSSLKHGFVYDGDHTVTLKLQGSNNGTDWTKLATQTVDDTYYPETQKIVELVYNGENSYTYHRILLTHPNSELTLISEVYFYEKT